MSEINERVRGLERTVAEIQVIIEERLSAIARDVSDIKELQVAMSSAAIAHAKSIARQEAMWEAHVRVHDIIIADIGNLYGKANRNAIGVAKLIAVGGGSGIIGGGAIYILAELIRYLTQ